MDWTFLMFTCDWSTGLGVGLFFLCAGSSMGMQMKDLLFIERRSHSSLELVKEFFNRTLLPLCDLTANSCDVNCCTDQDCDEEHIELFNCLEEADSFTADPIFSDPFHCYNNLSSDSSFFDPVLCYELENSPFLGVYFLEEKVLKRKALELSLENIVASRNLKYFVNVEPPAVRVGNAYKYGVPVELLDGGSPIFLPGSILGNGYCSYQLPIRFLVGTTSVCLSKMNEELCGSNQNLNLETYFQEDKMGELFFPEIRSGNTSSPVDASVIVLCGPDIFAIDDFVVANDIYTACEDLTQVKAAKYDAFHGKCKHVVTKVEYHFVWHGNYLLQVNVSVIVSDVLLKRRDSIIPSKKDKPQEVAQIFMVEFHKKESLISKPVNHGSYVINDNIQIFDVS